MTALGLTPTMLLAIGVIGVILLIVGLTKKIKFIIKLGIVIAVIGFIANGGLAIVSSYF